MEVVLLRIKKRNLPTAFRIVSIPRLSRVQLRQHPLVPGRVQAGLALQLLDESLKAFPVVHVFHC